MPDYVFDRIERTELRDPFYMEGHFSYLNVTARPEAGPVRDLIETWVREYPAARRPRIRGELRDDDKFLDAFFELFNYALLRRVGYEVEVEPRLRNGLTPDFAVSAPNGVYGYVEVTLSTGRTDYEAGREKLRNRVRDTINHIESPRHFIGLRFMEIGPKELKQKNVVNFVTECLRKLEEPSPDWEGFTFIEGPFRGVEFCSDGWAIELWFTPRNRPPSESNSTRSLGIETVWAGFNETPQQLMDKAKKKANKYKRIGAPFIIAVNAMANVANQRSVEEAVYGKLLTTEVLDLRGRSTFHTEQGVGLFVSKKGFVHSNVSAVLGGIRITPWELASRELVLYHHPGTVLPYDGALTCLPQVRRSADSSIIRTPGKLVRDILELPRTWPFS